MPSLRDFIEAMQASWPVALAISLASAGLLAADHFGLEYVLTLPRFVIGTAFVVGLCSTSVLLVAVLRGVAKVIFWVVRAFGSIGQRDRIIERLNNLPNEEMHVLVWAKVNNRQVFTASYIQASLVPLTAKGYVHRHGGRHNALDWPYSVNNVVWDALDAFNLPDASRVGHPFGGY